MANERVLITGGAGFIGSRLARQLGSEDADVLVLDNLHPQVHGNWPAAQDIGTAHLIRMGLGDAHLHDVIADFEPEIVYHLAAETGTGQSMETIARYCDVNATGTGRLLEALVKRGKGLRKLILASSRAVYGEGRYVTDDRRLFVPPPRSIDHLREGRFDITENAEGDPITPAPTTEDTPPRPASVYASTKLLQEYLVSQVCTAKGVPYSILRFQNVYGAGQSLRNPYTGVLSVFVGRLLRHEPIEVFEDGRITRDFVYVDDAVMALLESRREAAADSAIINIGTGKPVQILDLALEIIRLIGRPDSDLRISGAFRPGDIRFAVADIGRARRILDWSPEVSIEEGLKRLAQWARTTV